MQPPQAHQAILDLLDHGLYEQALQVLSAWPKTFERAWLEGCCYLRQNAWRQLEDSLSPWAQEPNVPAEVSLRLGIARHGQNRLEDAMATYLPVLASGSRPACFEDVVLQYGLASLELGLASHWLRLIERLDADASLGPRVLYLKGLACLGLGDYAIGWKYHEHRFSAGCSKVADLSLPFWSGDRFSLGHHLLLLGEQGYGDVIQFMRFAPRLRSFFERVSILVSPPLRRLAQASGLFDFVVSDQSDLPLGVTHALPLLSVPHRLSIHDSSLFFTGSYLRVDPADVLFWRSRFGGKNSRPVVAINWQGNRDGESPFSSHRERSLDLADFDQLSMLRRVCLVSVQLGEAADKICSSSFADAVEFSLSSLSAISADFYATASVLAACDLLITNDTSVAHLAGALGIPAWLLLKAHPSWQWGDEGAATSWYESIKCFRQHRPFCWEGVLRDVDRELAAEFRL